jgi:hypothetical protein
MGYKEEIAWRWERHKEFLDSKKPIYTAVKAAQENHQYDEFPVISLKVMRESGIQFLCSWSEDQPDTCEQPAIRLSQGDVLCNRHFLAKIGAIKPIKTSSIDNIKQAEEFKKRLDNLHSSKENELALNMTRYALLHRAVYNLSRGEEVPSLNEVISGEVYIHNIGTRKRMVLKEALELEIKGKLHDM